MVTEQGDLEREEHTLHGGLHVLMLLEEQLDKAYGDEMHHNALSEEKLRCGTGR